MTASDTKAMNRTIAIISMIVSLTACEAPDYNQPSPIGSATDRSTSSTSSESSSESDSSGSSDDTTTSTGSTEPGPCAAYLGCADACTDDACREDCASVTDVDVPFCEMVRCDALSDACANGDAGACRRLPECAASESSSDSSSSSGSESSGSSDDTSSSGESTT